jgi:UDP-N-acetylmuramoyl-L-alanyl-D-glutamate--2,6-diaminopimelate ligase
LAKLKNIIYGIHLLSIEGDRDVDISGITFDSREVLAGFLFIAIKGIQVDGHDYIEQAVANGATTIVCEAQDVIIPENISLV